LTVLAISLASLFGCGPPLSRGKTRRFKP